MGVYIPNMEKPKSCWECRLMDGEANCLVTDEGISFKQEGILPACPLIEIPTPHGRLIDKDELLSHLSKDPLFDLVERYGVSGVIESRRTILEAEE